MSDPLIEHFQPLRNRVDDTAGMIEMSNIDVHCITSTRLLLLPDIDFKGQACVVSAVFTVNRNDFQVAFKGFCAFEGDCVPLLVPELMRSVQKQLSVYDSCTVSLEPLPWRLL